jgi:HAD superfamily hydrolase (TIGR01458 family)
MKGCIFDVDGVLVYQGSPCPGAVEIIDALRKKGILLRFVTNSTLKSRESCAKGLQCMGFSVTKKEVITASYATALYLEALRPQSVWVLLEREGIHEFEQFNHDDKTPEYIVVGDYRDKFTFATLNKALRLLLKGAKLIGMSPERIDASMGDYELNVGSWVHLLEEASGVNAVYIGKPRPFMIELALQSMGLDKRAVIMVGDKVTTDIVGAHNMGIKAVLVKTGEFVEKDLDSGINPDYICDTITGVLDILK